jgi:NADP-dependent 3-hydroxy acid dehydrogenase YdfG
LKELNKGTTKILAISTDLKVEREVENLFQQVNKVFGRAADVVIANAGLLSDLKPMAEESVSTWWSVYVS